jgi:hypothetical protein
MKKLLAVVILSIAAYAGFSEYRDSRSNNNPLPLLVTKLPPAAVTQSLHELSRTKQASFRLQEQGQFRRS